MDPDVRRFPNLSQLTNSAAELISTLANEAIADHGSFNIALSGGTTPKTLFETLAKPPHTDTIPWNDVHIFWVDERCVPDDHPESNFNNAFSSLVSKTAVPKDNVRPILAKLGTPDQVAEMYEGLLKAAFDMKDKAGFPQFDLILLGVGPDGHVASLFPNSPALEEQTRWMIAVPPPPIAPVVERITMTLPVINNARNVAMLVSGEGKKQVVLDILADPEKTAAAYPAARVKPSGNLYWFLDDEFV